MKFLKRTLVLPLVILCAVIEIAAWWMMGESLEGDTIEFMIRWCRR